MTAGWLSVSRASKSISSTSLAPAAFIYPEPECAGPAFRLDEPDYMEGIRAAGPTVEPGTAPSDPPAGPSGLLEY